VALRCQPPTGKPSPTVSWQKDGSPVDTHRDGRVEVTNHSNLSLVLIRKAQTSDAGYYKCVASNLVGTQKSATIKLSVYGKCNNYMYGLITIFMSLISTSTAVVLRTLIVFNLHFNKNTWVLKS